MNSNNGMYSSILPSYIDFIALYIKYESINITHSNIITRYCIIKEQIITADTVIPLDSKWEFISLDLYTRIMTFRSIKKQSIAFSNQYELHIQLLSG